ncbi:aldolase [Lichtheimia hyalospora FSU 10163]|nr:aldolase [Lichtheimia hyalospora FSU 10163]
MVVGASLGRGVFVPIPTFFKDNEDLDFDSLEKHICHLSEKSLAGIILLGSNGEAIHLTNEERQQVITKGCEYVEKYDNSLKVIVGASAGSARATIELTKQAADAGAEYVMVLPPSYYRVSMDSEAIESFFTHVADQSPVPVVIYNYPGVAQGIDVSVQSIERLAKHSNIVGIKGTDGNMGKIGYLGTRIKPENNFSLLAGSASFFLPALAMGAVGLVPALGNVAPRACVEIQRLFDNGKIEAATQLQQQLVESDDALVRWYGNPGVKAAMNRVLGWGGLPRCPLRLPSNDKVDLIVDAVHTALSIERSLM